MNVEVLKKTVVDFNKSYRAGNSIISDTEYDKMLEHIKIHTTDEEYSEFIRTLTEEKGEFRLNYVVGSLDKIKYSEPEALSKWIMKEKINSLFVSLKVDGCSFIASYRKGKLVYCASRGDGIDGVSWTDKALHILPKCISYTDDIDIRGEFTLTDDLCEYANRRNGTVGIMNSKSPDVEKLSKISPIVYEVLSHNWNITEQFKLLQELKFEVPFYTTFEIDHNTIEQLKDYYLTSKEFVKYDVDGLVLSSPNYYREDVFLPKGKAAFKIAMDAVKTTITGITWELSKNRLMKPICQVTATEISGSTISNISGYNAKYIQDNGISTGAIVTIEKAGEIIPRIVEVIKPANEIELPLFCPECSNHLEWKGVELYCSNVFCGEVKRVEAFIKNLSIEKVSETTLRNWGITTFDKLLNWTPDTKLKSQIDFHFELEDKLFHVSPITIMRSFSYDGFGSTLFDSYLDKICDGDLSVMNLIINKKDFESNLCEGIGVKTLNKMASDWYTNYEIMLLITEDPRYKEPEQKKEEVKMETTSNSLAGKSFLFTGKMSQVRSILEGYVSENGGINGTVVNKNLSHLVCGGDSWNSSSKFKKAEKLAIPIITEEEFMEMIQ
jgi:DNA ligase (NAD+)